MVATRLTCPSCGAKDLDIHGYDSMMVLRKDTALFTVRCPHCAAVVSSVQAIPRELDNVVRLAAAELGAGMGRDS